MKDKISSYELAKRTYDIDTETSFGDKLFSAAESKAQQMYEGIKGLQLGYAQARLNALESTPDLVKDAEGNLKVGDIATKTVLRNQILEINKDIFESRMKTYTVAPEVMETSSYKLIDTGVQYGTNLAMSLIPVVGNVLTSAEMGAEILGGSFVEKLDKYKKDNPDDKMLEGFKIDNKDFAIATAKTAVNLYLEHKLGLFSQKKDVAKMFREGKLKTGALRMAGRAYAKGALKEFTTEGTQGTTDTAFDQWMGVVNESEVKDRIVQSWKDAVYAGFWGGLLEGGGAVAARGKAIQETKKAFLPNVESEEKAEVIATTIVDNLIEDTNAQIAVAAEMSSQLKARQGNLYNSLYRAVYRAVTDAKAQGAYSELSDDEIADYVASETAQQADIAMNEALKRKVPIQEVLDPNKIRYENGKIVLSENISEEQTLNQEVIKVAQRINEIDAEERARGIPEYTAPTINVNGVERQTTNSIGNPIARSQRSLEYFYNWFGDSKVVDEQGRPLVVYHGTERKFNIFKQGVAEGWGKGSYFTDNIEDAKEFGGNIYAVYLKIENPYTGDIDTLLNTKIVKEKGIDVVDESGYLVGEAIREAGFDGIVARDSNNINGLEVVVFNPNQIKSTSNEGSFSELTGDIYLQETEELIGKLTEIQKAQESGKEIDAVKAQNEGRNVIEMNVETFNNPESLAYMEKVATKKYKMSKDEFAALVDYMKDVADAVSEMAKTKKHKRFKEWNENVINRIKKGKGLIPVVSAFKKNGDYPLNFDLSSLCTRREATNNVVKHLINMGYAQQLGSTQLEAIKDILREGDFTTACDICFVESKRLRLLTIANTFAYEWESVRMALGITDDNRVGTPREFTPEQQKILNEMAIKGNKNKERREEAFNKYIPEERRRVKLNDKDMDSGITSDKMHMIAKLFKQDPSLAGVFDPEWLLSNQGVDWLMKAYVNTDIRSVLSAMFGTATPKPIEGFNVYDPLSWVSIYDNNNKADKLQKVFKIGGFRGQSFSDFNALQAFDYFQFFCDLAIRGLPIHMYTKVPALIKLFGRTGGMFNMSLVPEMVKGVDKEHAGLKPDGKGGWEYAWSKDSFPVDEAFSLRKEYDNAGIIAVGVSDAHILMMLDDPEIDMIIPYHFSGMSLHTRVKTGLNRANDYTDFQNTGKPKNVSDFSYNQSLQELGDPKKAAKAYLDWCAENGYTPKFPQFTKHENYYKLLEDFRGYDNKGGAIIQQAVSMSNIDAKTFANTLDQVLTEREAEVERQEHLYDDEDIKRKIDRLLSKQRLDGVYREAMINRLKTALGKENVNSMRQDYFLDQMRKDMIESKGEAEAKRMVEVFRNNDGVVYGYAKNGKIYLNENVFNANTPAHEFTHLWSSVARRVNPKLWNDGIKLLKQSDVWEMVENDPLYYNIKGNEDAVASEVLARIVGAENEKLIKSLMNPKLKPLREQNLVTQRIMEWFKKLWGNIRSIFDPYNGKELTYDEFIHMPLKDLWDETKNEQFNKSLQGDAETYFQTSTGSKGSITFGQNKTWIKLTKNADATTLRHEFAHYWLDSVSKYALSGYASDEYVANWNKMAKYLNWHENMSRKEMQVAQEKFARSYEQYIKGGRYNEDLAKMYEKYDRFLQRVYANVTPQYKEKGKMVTPKLSQDAIEFFHSMTSQLPQVETGSMDATKEQTDEVVMSKTFEPVQSAGVRQQSSVFKKHTAITGDSEILEYSRADLEEQNAKAEQILDTNPELAMQIMNVSGDNEVLTNAVFNAYIRRMREQGDNEAYLEALKKQSLFLTRLGQEISSQRGAIEAIFNPVYWINKAMRNQQDELGVKGLDDLIKSKLAEGKTATQAAKEISAEQGLKLFQDNNAENTVEGVKTQLGIGVSDEQAQKIVDMTEALQKSAQNSDATGNPSVQFFKNRRSLDDYINLIAPSSNLKVFTGVVARGSMLLSLKSPTTNIVGNAVKGVLSAARRRLTNLWDKKGVNDIVSNDLKTDYFNYANEVFDVSGMTISSMDELRSNEIWSEKFVSAEGEGVIQSWGRFMEKYAFKYLLGKPDLIAKNIAFVDTVAMEASNIALAEGKGQERANEIFSDAILIEPKTKIGKKVRLKGIEEALIATFQQSTKLSEFALKMREVINEKTGGMGDILIPFVKTPANIISLGIDASYGGAIAGIDILARGIKSGKFTITEGNKKKITRNALGLVTAALIAAMTDEDDYIPAYELCTPAEREFVKNTGGVFNAIRVGGVWISLDYLAGIGMPIVGFLQARREENALDKAWGYIQGTGKQALNTPVIAELKEYLVSVSKNLEGGVDKAGKNVLRETIDMLSSRVIPSFVGDIAKIIDPMERDASGSLIDPVLSKLPVIRGTLPEKQSILTGGSIEGQNPLLELFAGARVRVGAENELIDNIQKVLNSGLKVSLSDPMKYGKLKSLSKEDKVKARADFAEEFFKEASKARFIDPEEYADELNKIRQKIVNRLKRKYLD